MLGLFDVHWSLYIQVFHGDAIMGQTIILISENQRDCFTNDTFRGRSLVSIAVYYEVTPPSGHPNTFHYTYSDESDEDKPLEVLKVQKSIHPLSGSPTPSSDSILASPSPSLTPLGNSDFPLEETDAFLALDLIPPGIDNEIFDAEGDILLLAKLLNINSTKDLPPQELNNYFEGDILFLEKLLEDEPSKAKKSEIDPLIREPSDTFLIGDKEIKFNPLKDIDDPVPIPRVSEKPLDSLDPIHKTFELYYHKILLFDFDSEFTLNSNDPIFDI
ncbi:hypothetical protein Tco_1385674 [Tanacetum coccineum]